MRHKDWLKYFPMQLFYGEGSKFTLTIPFYGKLSLFPHILWQKVIWETF